MGLSMGERKALTEQVARRYRRAGKKEKAVMLGEFVQTTGYTRKYAIHLLNSWGRTRLVQIDGRMVKLVVGHPRRAKRRARPRRYDQEVLKALKQIWYVFDFMCGKRLVVVLRTMLPVLDSFGEIPLTAEVRAKLLTVSAATIDRLLQRERARLSLKGRSHTKPGTLLKHQIPIRTFADWNEKEPGYFEIDLVAHDGGDASGDFCQTLTITDAHCLTKNLGAGTRTGQLSNRPTPIGAGSTARVASGCSAVVGNYWSDRSRTCWRPEACAGFIFAGMRTSASGC